MQLTKFAAVVLIVAAVCLAVTAGCAVAAPADVPQQSGVPHHHHTYLSCPYSDAGQCPADCGWNQPRYADSPHRHHGRC